MGKNVEGNENVSGNGKDIVYFHRQRNRLEVEKVYGQKFLNWLYTSGMGKLMSPLLIRPPVSKVYGFIQSGPLSKGKIKRFVGDFQIDMGEYLPAEGRGEGDPYSSFNEFFIRRFRPGKRTFAGEKKVLPAFAEARYLAYEKIDQNQTYPVKTQDLTLQAILQKEKWAKIFEGGPLLIARLCPVDYHRFHFPDDGRVVDFYPISGDLHSVNPLALEAKKDIFCTNERQVSILETKNLGLMAYVEVGAMCVGKIVQAFDVKDPKKEFRRGEEKGHFLFGGSTVILIGQKGAWRPDEDLLQRTREGMETYIKLGEKIGEGQ